MKILIAEDDRTSRLFMMKFLEKYGSCDLAMNGIEAIRLFEDALLEKKPYDLVCLDVMMPKINGIKTLQNIRYLEKKKRIKACKVIIFSALNDDNSVSEAYESGCDDYVLKPIDMDLFNQKLMHMGLINE